MLDGRQYLLVAAGDPLYDFVMYGGGRPAAAAPAGRGTGSAAPAPR